MRTLRTPAELDAVLAAPLAIVFKHSTRCPISSFADDEMAALAAAEPDAPVWIVDVHADRAISLAIAERTGVTHHSPQVLVLVGGRAVWAGSHFDVRAEVVRRKVAGARAA